MERTFTTLSISLWDANRRRITVRLCWKRSDTWWTLIPSRGPYPFNELKKNAVCFTPTQIEAIRFGMQPGLTMVVISNMIISNIFHNFPEQRHSNIALNQLFEKIMALDIDERPLLRTVKKSWKRKRISADTVASITSCPSVWSFWNMFNDCSNPSVLPAMSRTRARVDTEEVRSLCCWTR